MKPNITPVTFTNFIDYFNCLGLSKCHSYLTPVISSVPLVLCPKYLAERDACMNSVTLMYDVAVGNQSPLKILSGQAAYEERQVQHCNCCTI